MTIPYEQQPGESRTAWKRRSFGRHYGMGDARLRGLFEQGGRTPQAGGTFMMPDYAFTFSPSADPTYSGRPDDWRYREAYNGRQRRPGETRTELAINIIGDWDQLGVELPELIMVPIPNDEGVFVITRMEA